MMREGAPTGVVTLTRSEARQFTDKQIELVTTFPADQAAIAIENVRLFEQVQERTRELSQSLDDLRKAKDLPCTNRETCFSRSTHCGHRTRNQEPAQFRQ